MAETTCMHHCSSPLRRQTLQTLGVHLPACVRHSSHSNTNRGTLRAGYQSLQVLASAATAAPEYAASTGQLIPAHSPGCEYQDKVVIVGAGIAGLATAAALHKVGIPCVVFEREPHARQGGSAIGMWTNALRALDALGVGDNIRRTYAKLTRIELCKSDGKVLRGFGLDECDGSPHEFYGVDRSYLLQCLQDLLPAGMVQYGVRIASVQEEVNGATVVLEDGKLLRARAVVGADGARSRVAASIGTPSARYAGYTAYRGVAHFDNGLPLPRDTCRQIWGAGVRAGMYPLNDTDCYWFTVFNTRQDAVPRVTGAEAQQHALSYVPGWQMGIREAITNTPADQITCSRIADRWPLPGQRLGKGAITLAGDAQHPMTPNLGQGGCTALEDAVVLARHLSDAIQSTAANQQQQRRQHKPSLRSLSLPALQDALRSYESERMKRCLPLSVRSNLMGQALQLPYAPVLAVRHYVVENLYSPAHFLEHATYDCGQL